MDLIQIATLLQRNNEYEAKAVADYNELLIAIATAEGDEETKKELTDSIKEIIGDELNHQEVLHAAYVYLSGIPAKED